MYARAFLENLPFDAITVAPYMGEDSITPFLSVEGNGLCFWLLHPTRVLMIFSIMMKMA